MNRDKKVDDTILHAIKTIFERLEEGDYISINQDKGVEKPFSSWSVYDIGMSGRVWGGHYADRDVKPLQNTHLYGYNGVARLNYIDVFNKDGKLIRSAELSQFKSKKS